MKEISLEKARSYFNNYQYDKQTDVVNGDIIGGLYNSDLLVSWRFAGDSADNSRKFDTLTEVVESWIQDKDKANELIQAITSYVSYQESVGFREGFNIALNIIVQGMRFPTNNN